MEVLETIFMGSFATVQVWLMLNKALRFFQRSSSLSRTVRRSLWQKRADPDSQRTVHILFTFAVLF